MNYYEHHLGDYMRDTAHLSLVEDGVYRRLIDAYYAREKPLPLDLNECCKLARVSAKTEREAVSYVLKEFFQKEEDGYHQKRCDEVIAKFRDKSEKAKRSAKTRWTQSDGSANAMRTHTEGNAPNNQAPVTSNQKEALRASDAPAVSAEASMAIAVNEAGLSVTSIHPTLVAWVRDGFTVSQVLGALAVARERKGADARITANYVDPILREPARPPPPPQASRVTWRPPPDDGEPDVRN